MKSYILSIIVAAIFCAVICVLLPPKTSTGKITRLLSGILLIVTITSPLSNLSFRNITDYIKGLSISAHAYTEEGSSVARAQMDSIIKSQTEAYILDKASKMGLQIAVEVALDENNHSIPCEVTVIGIFSPYSRENLGAYIENTLGIVKEKQKWISKG